MNEDPVDPIVEEAGGEETAPETAAGETAAGETPAPSGDEAEAAAEASVRLRSIVESLLFAAGEPITVGRIEKIARGYERKAILAALGAIAAACEENDRGIRLTQVAGGWQLRTPRENAEFIRQLREQRPVRLSRPALETLAIIAYRQPVTRAEVEAIRGVDVDAVVATLLERRLIRVLGRKDVIGHPLLYGTTAEFLETFGLKDLRSLPTLDDLGVSAEALERAAAGAIETAAANGEGELPLAPPVEFAEVPADDAAEPPPDDADEPKES